MVIPKGAQNIDAAAQWMNFVYDPVAGGPDHGVGRLRLAGRGRARGAREASTPELAENPLLFPDEATLAKTQTFAQLPEDVEAEYDAAFSAITGA